MRTWRSASDLPLGAKVSRVPSDLWDRVWERGSISPQTHWLKAASACDRSRRRSLAGGAGQSWAELGQVATWPRTAQWGLIHALGSASWSAWQTVESLVSKRAQPRSHDGRGPGPRRGGLCVQSP